MSESSTQDHARYGSLRYRIGFLVYLIIYPIPWFYDGFHKLDIAGSVVGIIAFLAVYLSQPLLQPRLWQGAAIAAIGFAMSPFHGIWPVMIVYAGASIASTTPRSRAVALFALLLVTLGAFCWLTGRTWPDVVFGASFSIASFIATSLTTDLARRHRQLLEAQGEVRNLAASMERERIARDLHDLLGHSLTVIAVKAELAERLAPIDPTRATREIHEIADTARQTLREVRAAVVGMHGASLPREIEQARAALQSAGITLHIHGRMDQIDPSQDGVLAMALREAITNVIRHAAAQNCTIRFAQERGKTTIMTIEDDGQSFIPMAARAAVIDGTGLRGMRSRLAAAGGALDVRQGAKGIRVTARLGTPA